MIPFYTGETQCSTLRSHIRKGAKLCLRPKPVHFPKPRSHSRRGVHEIFLCMSEPKCLLCQHVYFSNFNSLSPAWLFSANKTCHISEIKLHKMSWGLRVCLKLIFKENIKGYNPAAKCTKTIIRRQNDPPEAGAPKQLVSLSRLFQPIPLLWRLQSWWL